MALPKIAAPTFELTQPSTDDKIKYRPFLVKEEKALLIARESGERRDIFNAMKSVIQACVLEDEFDVNKIPMFDMEYIFLQIRAKSVDNIVKFTVDDSTDGKTYNLELNLDEVEVKFPEKNDPKIMINKDMGMILKYPTPGLESILEGEKTNVDIIFLTMMHCIDRVFDEENVYAWDANSEKEKKEFIESLPIEAYNKVHEFFSNMPSLEHVVTYENSDGVEKKVYFRSLDDFFTLY